jgi:hypothetical protein
MRDLAAGHFAHTTTNYIIIVAIVLLALLIGAVRALRRR